MINPMATDLDKNKQYYIVIEQDDKIQNEWRQAFANMPHSEPIITGSINEALFAWSKLFMSGCVPRCVIVDWKQKWKEVGGIEGGVNREGPHYFLHYCIDLSSEGTFVVYTDGHDEVVEALKSDPVVGPHVTIIRKDKYSVAEALSLVQESPAFVRQTSGCFQIP